MVSPVVLDVDTGIDDALALLLAVRSPDLDLRAVTCVAGNADVDQVVVNTLKVLDIAGAADVPVARGAERPLLAPAQHARHVHGDDGMGDLGLPASTRKLADVHAVELLRRTIEDASRPVTLVTLAPMTNVALLLRTYPRAAEKVARVMMMGGSAAGGNATAAAEFNVWHDPEAAAVVVASGVPLTMYGLDVFYDVELDRADADALIATEEPAQVLAGQLLLHQMARYTGTLGDAGAVAAVIDPEALTTVLRPVRVELAGTWTRGQTVVDSRQWAGDLDHDTQDRAEGLVDVATAVDAARLRTVFLTALGGRGSA